MCSMNKIPFFFKMDDFFEGTRSTSNIGLEIDV